MKGVCSVELTELVLFIISPSFKPGFMVVDASKAGTGVQLGRWLQEFILAHGGMRARG